MPLSGKTHDGKPWQAGVPGGGGTGPTVEKGGDAKAALNVKGGSK
jgi:hypothetical protein